MLKYLSFIQIIFFNICPSHSLLFQLFDSILHYIIHKIFRFDDHILFKSSLAKHIIWKSSFHNKLAEFSAITLCTGANEIFSQCGDDGCQRSCTRRETTGCNPVCRASGCICSANFVRNSAGQCVPLTECRTYYILNYFDYIFQYHYQKNKSIENFQITATVTCPNFETFSNCGEHNCIESCSFIPTLPCRKVCVDSGCVCNTGRFRNADRLCVPQRECCEIFYLYL